MFIVRHRGIFFAITGLLAAADIASLLYFGLTFGTDFTGGTLAEVRYVAERPEAITLKETLEAMGIEEVSVRPAGETAHIVRASNLSEEARAAFPEAVTINGSYEVVVERFTEVGPTIGVELRNKAIVALVLVITAIVLYIAFVFRKVSRPVSSWVYGLIAIVTLVFDVLIPVGVYALFGHLWGAAVDTLFVTALLTILGYSVHDTIVVFDRVRENLRLNHERNRHEDFETIAGRSINQTFVRSVNTSVTTLASLAMLYLIGPASTQNFALVLIVGIIAGTFSSIALATPLLVAVEKRLIRRRSQ